MKFLEKSLLCFQIFQHPSDSAWVSGWGYTLKDGKKVYPNELNFAVLDFRAQRETIKKYGGGIFTLTENMIFAGGKKDACDGDSGGPLTCTQDTKRYLCGIVSWGMKCNDPEKENFPSVYTDVRKYGSWVSNQLDGWGKVYIVILSIILMTPQVVI